MAIRVLLLAALLGLAHALHKDPYQTLGLSKGASTDQIKRAYRKLALKHHPDKAGPKANNKKFLEIQEAYDILSDPDKKRQHDLGADWQEQASQWSEHQHWQHSWRHDWQDSSQSHDKASATIRLTTSNIANNVLFSQEPWLILVYADDNQACRNFASTWESLYKVVSGGPGDDQPWVRMGRIDWRTQRTLAFWAANNRMSSQGFSWDLLPAVFAVRPECRQSECFIRYRGELSMSGLQDFVADQLLRWRPIPQVQLNNLEVFLHRAHPAKVIALAFSKSAGQGSLSLRHVADVQEHMMQFARVSLSTDTATTTSSSGETAAAWEQRLGVTGIKSPCLVLLRGPGTTPLVVPVKAGTLESTIAEKTLMWQTIPALRPDTVNPLGCRWGGAAGDDYFYSDYIAGAKLCVVVISHDKHTLTHARHNMLRLHDYLLSHEASRTTSVASASSTFKSGQIRLTWLDASIQTAFCRSHLKGYDIQFQQAVCGWSLPTALAQLLADFSTTSLLRLFKSQPPETVLVAFKPSTPGSSSSTHTFSLLRSRLMSRDMSGHAESATELQQIAAWVDGVLKVAGAGGKARRGSAGEQVHVHVVAGRDVPPGLVPDDDPNAIDFLIDRAVEIARQVMGFLISCFSPQDWSPELQTVCAAICTCLILLVTQMVLQGNGQHVARPHDADEEVEELLRRQSEAEEESEWEEMHVEDVSEEEEPRGRSGHVDRWQERGQGDDGGLGRARARSNARGDTDGSHDRQRRV